MTRAGTAIVIESDFDKYETVIKEALNNSSMNDQNTNRIKDGFILFFIVNGLSASDNGNTSTCCGNSELIRASSSNRRLLSQLQFPCRILQDVLLQMLQRYDSYRAKTGGTL
jgi:hypothetical protein